jgi:hypothetical protein
MDIKDTAGAVDILETESQSLGSGIVPKGTSRFPRASQYQKARIPARSGVFVMTNKIISLQESGFKTVSKI